MSQQTVDKAGNLPDPAEMAKTYAEGRMHTPVFDGLDLDVTPNLQLT